MKANYHVDEGDLRVIRPLIFTRESITREYATAHDLPVIFENCPACFEAPKERQRIKLMLAAQEHLHPHLYSCLLRAMTPLIGKENGNYLRRMNNGGLAAPGTTAEPDDCEDGMCPMPKAPAQLDEPDDE